MKIKYQALGIIYFVALAVASEVSCSRFLQGRSCSEAHEGLRRCDALIPRSLFEVCLRHRKSLRGDDILPLTAPALRI